MVTGFSEIRDLAAEEPDLVAEPTAAYAAYPYRPATPLEQVMKNSKRHTH